MLNAFLISTLIVTANLPLLTVIKNLSLRALAISSVYIPLRKSYWFFNRPLRVLTCSWNLLTNKIFNILPMSLSKHNGRYEDGPHRLFFHFDWTILTLFHSGRKDPARRHMLYMLTNVAGFTLCTTPVILLEIVSSQRVILLPLILFTVVSTSSWVNLDTISPSYLTS